MPPLSLETLEEKPYNVCISCSRIGQTCDGPNFLAMSVDRIMSGDVKDLRITTMQAVSRALVNGTWGQSPCVLVTETEKEIYIDNPVIVAQCQHLQDTLDHLSDDYKMELATVRAEAQQKIDFLREQVKIKDKHIELLHSLIQSRG